MPGPEIMGGEGVVFAFVSTCPTEHDPEKWEWFSEQIMRER